MWIHAQLNFKNHVKIDVEKKRRSVFTVSFGLRYSTGMFWTGTAIFFSNRFHIGKIPIETDNCICDGSERYSIYSKICTLLTEYPLKWKRTMLNSFRSDLIFSSPLSMS